MLRYLKTPAGKLNRGLGHHRLMLATVDNVWCSVVGAYISEDQFLEGQGVFLLLDLLEVGPRLNLIIIIISGANFHWLIL